MAVLGSKFDILRGWPYGSAVTEDFAINPLAVPVATRTHQHRAGEWVELDSTSAAVTRTTNAAVNSSVGNKCALIIEGFEDYSAIMARKVTCMVGGGYIVRLTNNDGYEMYDEAINNVDVTGDYVPGAQVKILGSIIAPAYRAADGTVIGYNHEDDEDALVAAKAASDLDVAVRDAGAAAIAGDEDITGAALILVLADVEGAVVDGQDVSSALVAARAVVTAGPEQNDDPNTLAAAAQEASVNATTVSLAATAAAQAAVQGGVGGMLPPGVDVEPQGEVARPENAWNALAVAVLDARDAAIGHVLRFDSSAKVLEIYVD